MSRVDPAGFKVYDSRASVMDASVHTILMPVEPGVLWVAMDIETRNGSILAHVAQAEWKTLSVSMVAPSPARYDETSTPDKVRAPVVLYRKLVHDALEGGLTVLAVGPLMSKPSHLASHLHDYRLDALAVPMMELRS